MVRAWLKIPGEKEEIEVIAESFHRAQRWAQDAYAIEDLDSIECYGGEANSVVIVKDLDGKWTDEIPNREGYYHCFIPQEELARRMK